jgi:hypothetical protein
MPRSQRKATLKPCKFQLPVILRVPRSNNKARLHLWKLPPTVTQVTRPQRQAGLNPWSISRLQRKATLNISKLLMTVSYRVPRSRRRTALDISRVQLCK